EDNKSRITMVEQEMAVISKEIGSYTDLELAVELANSEIVNSSLKKNDAILGSNGKITNSAKALADNLQLTASQTIEDTDTMTSVLDKYSSELEGSLSVQPLENYGKAMETLKEKQAEGLSTTELEEYEVATSTALKLVEDNFMALAKASGIKVDTAEWNELKSVFSLLGEDIKTLGMSAEDLAKSLNIPLADAEALIAVAASMGDGFTD